MKPIVKIIILCILIFGLSIYATKKSIDNTFKKVECTQTNEVTSLHFFIHPERLS